MRTKRTDHSYLILVNRFRRCCLIYREKKDCQPNFRRNVIPNPEKSCGPYRLPGAPAAPPMRTLVPKSAQHAEHAQYGTLMPEGSSTAGDIASVMQLGHVGRHDGSRAKHAHAGDPRGLSALPRVDEHNHDTIAMVAVDERGSVAAGASSNGASHKVRPGFRVDPLPSSMTRKERLLAARTSDVGTELLAAVPYCNGCITTL